MPITIKELLPSDLMAQVVEKINFNFDQLLLAGGGPPGPQGPIGPAGVPGPIGPRGDHWFVGASAFNQIYDHDGISPLKVEDHFLDPLGDVYSYFDIAGVTGWTYSGINLMGPTGPTGATGGSNEWFLFEASLPTNTVPGGYQPSYYAPSTTQTPGTLNIDYLIPSGSAKNSIFIGDANWAFTELENYGNAPVLSPSTGDTSPVPKVAIIQNNTNLYGMNGLVIGAMGVTAGVQANPIYGSVSDKTNARDFFYAGFANELTAGGYQTKFLMRLLTMPMRIQIGGQRQGEATYPGKEFELYASDIRLDAYDTGVVSQNFIRARKVPVFSNIGVYNGNAREIILNSLSNLSGNNIWGYVGLQNLPGSGGISILGLQHEYGTVIIGPTYSSSLDRTYGLPGRQGLAIVRKITGFSNSTNTLEYTIGQTIKDSAISFFQMDYAKSNDTDTNSAIGGRIIPVRIFNDSAFWSDEVTTGDTPDVIDAFIIGSGLRSSGTLNTSATAGGRISIQNRITDLGKPQMTFHVSLDTDDASRNIPWDGGPSTPGIQHWAVGFDQWAGETRPGGIGIAYSPWTDGFTTLGNYRRNPVIQTYYRRDRGTSQPNDGFGSRVGMSQGNINPHMYLQTGGQNFYGNIGIGFYPGDASYLLGSTSWNGNAAFAKLSMQGTLVVGSISSGYHKFNTSRFDNSILIEGNIIQGATALFDQINTAVHGYTSVNTAMNGFIAISSRDAIFGKGFVARGFKFPVWIPDFALPDMKTGMSQGAANPGIGYLVANNAIPASTDPYYPNVDVTTNPTRIAKFAGRGEAGYTGNNEYGSFTTEATFSTRPRNIGVNDLVQRISTLSYPGRPDISMRTVWEIPTNSSLIFLDLSGKRTVPTLIVENPSLGSWVSGNIGTYSYYLNGAGEGGTPPTITDTTCNAIGFTLQDGHFDGQHLKLIVLDANSNNVNSQFNVGALLPGVPLFNGITPQGYTGSNIPDNIIMSPEPLWQGTGTPFSTNVLSLFNLTDDISNTLRRDGVNNAYPLPFGLGPSGPLVAPSVSTVTVPQINTALSSLTNSINTDMALWTNNALSGQFSGVGFGCFYLFPYRSIEFVWRFDSPTGTSGKWFEIGRENLVRPQSRSYNPFDFGTSTPTYDNPGDGDSNPIEPGPSGICCFAPGTMISMADGTLKEIENIQIGDLVLSLDESTKEIVTNEVKLLSRPNRNDLAEIFFDDGTSVKITPDHPIYIVDKGWSSIDAKHGWTAYKMQVQKVEIGDVVFGINGNKTITDIIKLDISIQTYTFKNVNQNAASYFANGILAHNKIDPHDPFTGGNGEVYQYCIGHFPSIP